MRQITIRAIFDVFFPAVFEMTSASVAQEIQGAITEKTVKVIVLKPGMAGEIFALMIAEKFETVFHTSYYCINGIR